MPCYDIRDHPAHYASALEKDVKELTELLCKAGRAYWAKEAVPYEVMRWWEWHSKIDASKGKPWKISQE